MLLLYIRYIVGCGKYGSYTQVIHRLYTSYAQSTSNNIYYVK